MSWSTVASLVRGPAMQLDTHSTERWFDVAHSAHVWAGVITVFPDAAPEPGTQVAAWLRPGRD